MVLIKTGLEGLFIIQHKIYNDSRGVFVKTYNSDYFKELGLNLEIKEKYYSISAKNVIRGMHFQSPPYDHIKLVTVLAGKILDVVLDIRKSSETFGKYYSLELDSKEGKTIYIPRGFAHGFKALIDDTVVDYSQTTGYAPNNDDGIKFDSFGFDWGKESPMISSRDSSFESFKNFKTPFI